MPSSPKDFLKDNKTNNFRIEIPFIENYYDVENVVFKYNFEETKLFSIFKNSIKQGMDEWILKIYDTMKNLAKPD